MSYSRKPNALGDTIGAIVTAAQVTQDPYFVETVCHVQQLHAINNGLPVPACAKAPAGMQGGVGLGRVQSVLRAYVYAEQKKWIYPVAIAGVIGIPMLLGYLIAKES